MRIAVRNLDTRLARWGFPRWGSAAAAGLDLHACIDAPITLGPQAAPVLIPAGFSLRMTEPGWCALVLPRSGLGHRDGLVLGNGTGVIDADYEGPVLISVWNRNPPDSGRTITISPGERIAQMVFTPVIRPLLDLSEDEAPRIDDGTPRRGEGGFGSTGR